MTHEPNTAVSAPYTVGEGVVEAMARAHFESRYPPDRQPVNGTAYPSWVYQGGFSDEGPEAVKGRREWELSAMRAAIAASPLTDLVAALERARHFIKNGVDLGFIRMPDAITPDSAHDTLPAIEAALAKAKGEGEALMAHVCVLQKITGKACSTVCLHSRSCQRRNFWTGILKKAPTP